MKFINKQIVAALRIAREQIEEEKETYICFALISPKIPRLVTYITQRIIRKRIAPHVTYPDYLDSLLPGMYGREIIRPSYHKTLRLRWLNHLIKEFS